MRPQPVGSILYGADDLIAKLVLSQIPEADKFEKFRAIGVLRPNPSRPEPDLIGGVVFHNFKGHDVEMSAAMLHPRWATREVLRRLFGYPFITMGCRRMTTITCVDNEAARRADEHMGFILEGTHRGGWDGVRDAVSYGMLRDECRWLKD